MKLSKIIAAAALFSSIFASANEEDRRVATFSYDKVESSPEERFSDVITGAGSTVLGSAGLHELDKGKINTSVFKPKLWKSPWYRASFGAMRVPFYAITLYGAYLLNRGLLTKYYTSNWAWNIKTKNYEISYPSKNNSAHSMSNREDIWRNRNRETVSFYKKKKK